MPCESSSPSILQRGSRSATPSRAERTGGHGEVEALYVEEAYRNRGIGGALLDHAAAWMDELETVEQALAVFAANDRVLPFYARHGFSPRFVVLVRRPPV